MLCVESCQAAYGSVVNKLIVSLACQSDDAIRQGYYLICFSVFSNVDDCNQTIDKCK